MRLKGNLYFDGPITQESSGPGTTVQLVGPVTVELDLTAGGISLMSHTHPVNGSETGPPQ